MSGKCRFLASMYTAHSQAEDAVVLPALQAKLDLPTEAYTMDHEHEGAMLQELEVTIARMQACEDREQMLPQVREVRRMCVSLLACLKQHVRAEEESLWPLFVEHFTHDEQQLLVGEILGRTGAEVMSSMLPWVARSCTEEEEERMYQAVRDASRNTMFGKWLEAVTRGGGHTGVNTSPEGSPQERGHPEPPSLSPVQSFPLASIAGLQLDEPRSGPGSDSVRQGGGDWEKLDSAAE